ncbi:helix-turn-helix domain-containing protein [Roseateles microcysteis]|uniref:helix-turn-helix domain-containing protein n=1 Tax=Roseateles microcysteis TaxID=3119057 RepID=UPI002FE50166
MNAKICSRLPSMIRAAREAAGVSQKALAADLAVDQTQLCALEKGRRGVQDRQTLERIASALRLDQAALDELVWAMSHDRVVASVERSGLPKATALVSLALQASRALSQEEMRGLESLISDLLEGKRQLSRLALRSKEEPAMT